ncbi:MAG TPA: cytochrome c biogenesis protein CcdA [Acidiferrobacterales bacterium]|nr:cytochrome c biogenesis protein CcdA [Acidiferrobacterales bacterium]
MDTETLKTIVEQASFTSLSVGFLTGFIFSFNPVALAAIPVSLAYVTKARDPRESILFGGMFILGMIITHALLGFIAGLGGQWLQKLMGREWGLVLGPLLILLGLMWAGWIKIPLPTISMKAKRAAGVWGAFSLGAPFSVAICPFCTPALIILLGVVVGIGSPLFGVALLLAFALGRAIPIILGAVTIGWLQSLKVLGQYQKAFEIIGAIILLLSGLYMLNAYFFVIPELAA